MLVVSTNFKELNKILVERITKNAENMTWKFNQHKKLIVYQVGNCVQVTFNKDLTIKEYKYLVEIAKVNDNFTYWLKWMLFIMLWKIK